MPKHSKTTANLAGSAEDVESTFYEALQTADLDRLMSCWADDDEVVCIHPGSPRLVGLGAIRATFELMLSNGNVRISTEGLRKFEVLGTAVHSVRERIDVMTNEGPMQVYLLATNVYCKTSQGWRLVVHHASPSTERDARDITELVPVLH